ncbi:hypothetical protein AN958_04249 [Leucoagaricus sp. SymC.cos]|nr:hypothetical protein AN958_04249 [Leucoagaricus sp. SymC.cos]
MSPSLTSDDKTPEASKVELTSDAESEQENRRKLERKLIRTLDIRMTMLGIIFVFNYIDRTNIATARLGHLENDLHLDARKAQFETLLGIFYVGYILMMVPSNMLLHRLGRPSIYLSVCSMLWSIVSICTGALLITLHKVSRTSALLTRFFLGFVEAVFLPGALFTLASWYTREELGLRTCLMWVGLLIAIPFGQLLAQGVLNTMEGVGGYSAWRWIFFIEGIVTFVVTLPAFYVLPDFPHTASSQKWLHPELLKLAKQRKIEEMEDLAKIEDVSQKRGFVLAVKDWKVWWLALTVGAYQLSQGYYQYFPTLASTLGYNRNITLVLCAPPGFASAIFTFFVSRHSDKVQKRFPHIVFCLGLSAIGWIMAMSTMNVGVRYTSIFFMEAIPGGFVVLIAWVNNIIAVPPAKKAVALGLIVAFSQLGTLASSYVYPQRWGPQYTISFGITIGAAAITVLMCFILRQHLASENKKAQEAMKQNPELRPYFYQL